MGIRSQNNPAASYLDKWVSTGTDAYLWTEPAGLSATGGIISDYVGPSDNIWRCHVFANSGTLDVTAVGDYGNYMEYAVIAGGGGGGCNPGPGNGGRAGGGAGGLRTNYPSPENSWGNILPATSMEYPGSGPVSYTVTVGGGGRGSNDGGVGASGGNSSIVHPSLNSGTGIVATGGGGGTGDPGTPGSPGGCGGGAAYDNLYGTTVASPDGISPTVQGTDGGPGNSPNSGGAGGGGLGSAGSGTPALHGGGDGGAGMFFHMAGNSPTTISGLASGIFYWSSSLPHAGTGAMGSGGGGGGGYPNSGGPPGGNAAWGGGLGADKDGAGSEAGNGVQTTGAGGGGGSGSFIDAPAGTGGSGCVLVRYQIAAHNTGTARATGGMISYYGGKTIHAFTNTGRFATPLTLNPGGASITDAEVVVVGGGGGGGWDRGAGGGAGSYVHATSVTIPHSTGYGHGITVGAGGRGGEPGVPDNSGGEGAGRKGSNSEFPGASMTANGGGGGGAVSSPAPSSVGSAGGSGGGGGGAAPGAGGSGTAPPTSPSTAATTDSGGKSYQNDGGAGNVGPYPYIAGGGGGAGGAGTAGPPSDPSPYDGASGGIGVQLPTTFQNPVATYGFPGPGGTRFWVAGGGGSGAVDSGTGGGGAGAAVGARYAGAGVGGDSPAPPATPEMPGATMSGSGGGGGGNNPSGTLSARGGNGGYGLVIIAYPS